MRLHSLEVTAFGPFGDSVRVDFDALSDAGLFLLAGPTGAGKSSVLDAVCFALYGDVPGDRSTAKRLRSDHAEEGVAPRVILEVTLSGRRFRLDRSPAWQRPKKRGTGMTSEQARVTLSERVVDEGEIRWRPLSTRLDETGHLVTRLVGMNLPQFCQVALLPQGRFQAFLRAGSEERHALLQQVFQTGRFDQMETWLRNRRSELRRASESHQARIADQVSRISEVTSSPAPDDWAHAPELLHGWVSVLTATTVQQLDTAAQALHDAVEAEAVARADQDAGLKQAEALRALEDARECADELAAAQSERERVGTCLESARRAAVVRPLRESVLTAEQHATTAEDALDAAMSGVARAVDEPVDALAGLEPIRHRTIAQHAEVERLRPVAARAASIRLERAAHEEKLAVLQGRRAELDMLAQMLPDELEGLRSRLQGVTSSAARVEVLREKVASLRERRAAAQLVSDLESQAADAETERLQAVSELHAAKETWLGVRERRLDGMAAEIASSLVVGGCCPVCGSADHPSPAVVQDGTPDVDTERAARGIVDDLEVVVEARTQHSRELESRLAKTRGAAGHDVDALPDLLTRAETALSEAEDHVAELPGLTSQVGDVEARLTRLAHDREASSAEVVAEVGTLDRLAHEQEACLAQVDAALAGTGHQDLDEHSQALQATQQAVSAAASALRAHDSAQARLAQTVADLRRAATDAGFLTPEAAADAWLPADEISRLEAWAREHDQALDRARAVLADPVLRAAATDDPPDLTSLEQAHETARAAALHARRAHDALAHRNGRLEGLAVTLLQALSDWEPIRSEHEAVGSLASFVEGKSPDNRLQMRLSAYVLAHRLSQVVEAANLRLHTMSDQRYSLVHTGRRGAGDKRGGLSLVVSDDWSGETRDPATLSGGETFVVSLALALGLADVITAEAGGADLDTLFVDEGFGSLDAETLDDVMDTLDSLRDGGRVVGVVSHVAEMQIRIPTQLRVLKARHGSRVTQ